MVIEILKKSDSVTFVLQSDPSNSGRYYGENYGKNYGEVNGENHSGNAVNNDSNGDRLAYSVVTHSVGLVICQGISHLLVGTPL